MIINISDVWDDAREEHVEFLQAVINKGLKALGGSKLEKKINIFINESMQVILHGLSNELLSVIERFENSFGDDLRPKAIKKLKEIFDYNDFSKKSGNSWTAYNLCSKARYQTCSYCHLVHIGTSLPNENTKGYRPPIDHYYAKSDYPFLSLTLSNFVPCCEKCNGSQMKGQIDFFKEKHLNPLTDDESIVFFLAADSNAEEHIVEAVTLNLPVELYHLKLKIINNHPLSGASLKTFQLASRYVHYSAQAFYLARKLRGASARLRMHDSGLDFDTSIDDYLEFAPANYKKVAFGKARICIAKQFDAIPE